MKTISRLIALIALGSFVVLSTGCESLSQPKVSQSAPVSQAA